jgi:hypothetical protein
METKGIMFGIHHTQAKPKKTVMLLQKWQCRCPTATSAKLLRELPPL